MATDMFGNILSPEEEERLRLQQQKLGLTPNVSPLSSAVSPSLYPYQAAPYGSFPMTTPTTPSIWESPPGVVPSDPQFAGPTVNKFKPLGSDYTPKQLGTPIEKLLQQDIPSNVVPFTPSQKVSGTKSIQEILANAMKSKGMLTEEQARIRNLIETKGDPTTEITDDPYAAPFLDPNLSLPDPTPKDISRWPQGYGPNLGTGDAIPMPNMEVDQPIAFGTQLVGSRPDRVTGRPGRDATRPARDLPERIDKVDLTEVGKVGSRKYSLPGMSDFPPPGLVDTGLRHKITDEPLMLPGDDPKQTSYPSAAIMLHARRPNIFERLLSPIIDFDKQFRYDDSGVWGKKGQETDEDTNSIWEDYIEMLKEDYLPAVPDEQVLPGPQKSLSALPYSDIGVERRAIEDRIAQDTVNDYNAQIQAAFQSALTNPGPNIFGTGTQVASLGSVPAQVAAPVSAPAQPMTSAQENVINSQMVTEMTARIGQQQAAVAAEQARQEQVAQVTRSAVAQQAAAQRALERFYNSRAWQEEGAAVPRGLIEVATQMDQFEGASTGGGGGYVEHDIDIASATGGLGRE